MKKLALLFFVFLGLAGVAQAQDKQDNDSILTMPVTAPCTYIDTAVSTFELKYGEYPFAQGAGIVWNSKIKEYIEVKLLVFLNPKTFTFTIAYEVPGDNLLCIMMLGDDFQPVRRGSNL